MSRTPLEIVRAYLHDLWDGQRPEMVRELCAEPMIRHYPGRRVEMTHEEQIARIAGFAGSNFRFEDILLHGEGEYVTSVWNSIGEDGKHCASGIEIFRVADDRIVEVWNAPYGDAHWG